MPNMVIEFPTPTPDLAASLKEKAKEYTDKNLRHPTSMDYLFVENAMMIGAFTAMADVQEKKG